ncbi:MAG: aminopeptidase [Acidobacteria bacterium]|nr:aminopeptidase [Acidobacteriota bacterium]
MRLSRSRRSATLGLGMTAVVLLSSLGCGVGYYTRTAWGGAKILARRDSIDRLVRDPRTDQELRRRLLHARQARDFASQELALPDNKSYRQYSEVRKAGARSPYVVWNVVATPELSVEPLEWCFPIAGCVIYRGYFSQERAERFGSSLRKRGHDVEIYGVRAYSTLGRFADPVLSTFLYGSDPAGVASYLFHELAHQVAYVKGDAGFNESFATLVEEEGLRRWLESRAENDQMEAYLTRRARDEEFRALVLAYRERLSACYAQDRLDEWKRAEKARLISQLKREYGVMKAGWGGDRRWDGWVDGEVNNADFALMASYHGLVPGFRQLLEQQGNDLSAFYEEVARIAALGRAERSAFLGAEPWDHLIQQDE